MERLRRVAEPEGWKRWCSLERAVESLLSVKKEKNLCHQTLSLSHANTREINFAWKIWGYNCYYWFIVCAKQLFDVFKGAT